MAFLQILSLFLWGAAAKSFDPCDPRMSLDCTARNQAIKNPLSESLLQESKIFIASDQCPMVCQTDDGTTLSVTKRFDNPRLYTETYLMYGKVEMEIKAAKGTGVISSFYLLSDDQDEIDVVELFGGDHGRYETNYFTKGHSATEGDGTYISVSSSPIDNFHKYGVIWTEEKIEWYLDGNVVRQVLKSDTTAYPNSPMRLLVSLWAGGDVTNENGTVEWAGGTTNYNEVPFTMTVRNLVVENYSQGEYYQYTNNTQVTTHNVALKSFMGSMDEWDDTDESEYSDSSDFSDEEWDFYE